MTRATVCDGCGDVIKENSRRGTYHVTFAPPNGQGMHADADLCPTCMPDEVIDLL